MKTSEADILMIPGYTNSGPDHWMTRWQNKLSTARRVEQVDWVKPVVEDWTARVTEAVEKAERPVVAVAHSLGCSTLVKAVEMMEPALAGRIRGAFMVAPPDVENPSIRPRHLMTFGPSPRGPLPFPSVVIASRDDPFCSYEVADEMAAAWGSLLIDAGQSGHLNAASGHGPWPEGTMVFSKFLNRLPLEQPDEGAANGVSES